MPYYYKIKCPRCLHIMKSDEVVYKLIPESFKSDEIIFNDTNENKNENNNNIQNTDKPMTIYEISKIEEFKGRLKPKKVSPKMPKIFAQGDKEEINKWKEKNRFFFESAIQEDENPLVTEYELTEPVTYNSKTLKGILYVRRCPLCNTALVEKSGEIPIFNISMAGHSRTGKTVMLTMQHVAQSIGENYYQIYDGRVSISTDSAHWRIDGIDDEIEKSAKSFISNDGTGKFPPTTQNIPTPHCMHIEYKEFADSQRLQLKTESVTECVLVFHDLMGEAMTRRNQGQQEINIINICRKSDGLYVIIDPFSLENSQYIYKQARVNHETTDEFLENLRRISENQKGMSTLFILTKTDELTDVMDTNNARNKYNECISENNIIVTDFESAFRGRYVDWNKGLERLNVDIARVLESLGTSNWTNVTSKFGRKNFFSISSIGMKSKIINIPSHTANETQKNINSAVNNYRTDSPKKVNLPANYKKNKPQNYKKDMPNVPILHNDMNITNADDAENAEFFLGIDDIRRKTPEPENTRHEDTRKNPNVRNSPDSGQTQTIQRIISKRVYDSYELSKKTPEQTEQILNENNLTGVDKQAITPVGLEPPLLYLLMTLNMLPPMHMKDFYTIPHTKSQSNTGFFGALKSIFAGGNNEPTLEECITENYKKWKDNNSQTEIEYNIEKIIKKLSDSGKNQENNNQPEKSVPNKSAEKMTPVNYNQPAELKNNDDNDDDEENIFAGIDS